MLLASHAAPTVTALLHVEYISTFPHQCGLLVSFLSLYFKNLFSVQKGSNSLVVTQRADLLPLVAPFTPGLNHSVYLNISTDKTLGQVIYL